MHAAGEGHCCDDCDDPTRIPVQPARGVRTVDHGHRPVHGQGVGQRLGDQNALFLTIDLTLTGENVNLFEPTQT